MGTGGRRQRAISSSYEPPENAGRISRAAAVTLMFVFDQTHKPPPLKYTAGLKIQRREPIIVYVSQTDAIAENTTAYRHGNVWNPFYQ